jgi:hypothetical protein
MPQAVGGISEYLVIVRARNFHVAVWDPAVPVFPGCIAILAGRNRFTQLGQRELDVTQLVSKTVPTLPLSRLCERHLELKYRIIRQGSIDQAFHLLAGQGGVGCRAKGNDLDDDCPPRISLS